MTFLWAIWTLIGGIRGVLTGVAFSAVTLAAIESYHWAFIHPGIARESREGFVTIAELEAEKAKNAELLRQINAGAIAIEEHRKRLAVSESERERSAAELEREIAEYEEELEAAGRSCILSQPDVDSILRKP